MKYKFIKRLFHTIALFDFVSYKPKLLYKGKNNFQSSIGGIISLLTISFLFSFGIYFFIQLFERKSLNITSNDNILEWPAYNMSNMPFIFKLVDGNTHDIANDSTVFSLQGLFSSKPAFYYNLEPCNISNVKHFGQYRKYFENIGNIGKFNCIDNLNKYNFSLFGTYQNNELPRSFINIILNICQNATDNKDKPCKTRSFIDNNLTSAYLNLIFLEHKIDHNNFHDPGLITVSTEILSFSSSIYKRYNFFYSLIDYQTDEGLIFPQISTKTYFQKQQIDVSVDLRVQLANNVKFGQICFYLSKDQKSYFRKYTKVQEVIASIGGILSSVLFLANIVLYHVSRRLFLIRLANDSYVSREKDKKRRISKCILDKEVKKLKSKDESKDDEYDAESSYSNTFERKSSIPSCNFKENLKTKINNLDETLSIPEENQENKEKVNVYVQNFPKHNSKFETNLTNLNNLTQKSVRKTPSMENEENEVKSRFVSEKQGENPLKDKEIKVQKKSNTDNFESKALKSGNIKEQAPTLPRETKIMVEKQTEKRKSRKTNSIKFDKSCLNPEFEKSIDENGKLKENFRNIFWPSKGVKKLYEFIEKRSGLDSTLNYCSQIEKIKKFLFQTKEEIRLFNNLPDLDVEEIMEGNEKSEEHLKHLILKIKEKNPDTKLIKMIKNL